MVATPAPSDAWNESDGSEPNKFKKQLHLWPKVLEGFCRWPLVGGFNQPLWKICSSQHGNQSSPNHFRGENKDKIELPPSRWGWLSHWIYQKNKTIYIYIYPKRIENFLFRWHTWEGCLLTSPEQPRSLRMHTFLGVRRFFFVFRFGSFKQPGHAWMSQEVRING